MARRAMLEWRFAGLAAVALLAGLAAVFWNLQPAAAPGAQGPAAALHTHVLQERKWALERRFSQGVALLQARRYEAAATEWHAVLALAPGLPQAHVNMGFAMLGLNRFAAARDCFAVAIDLNKNQLNAYYGLALALEGRGDLVGALGAMRSYIHLTADDVYSAKARAAIDRWEATVKQRAKGGTQ